MEDSKRELTKQLIAESVKELMKVTPFERLTIKQITDKAGLIRPAFYRYFVDKYEVLEWIFVNEVLKKSEVFIRQGRPAEAMEMIFHHVYHDRAFYRACFDITGQNNFADAVTAALKDWYLKLMEISNVAIKTDNPMLTKEKIAQFKSATLTVYLRDWVTDIHREGTIKEATEAYLYLMTHPAYELKK